MSTSALLPAATTPSEPRVRIGAPPPWWALTAAALCLGGWLLLMLAYALQKASVFDGWLFDGTFQLLNPLRRIAAGQHVGVDYQVFHGAGLPYLHYPLFAALGGTLFAEEFSRYAVTAVCHGLALVVVAAAFTRSARWGVVLGAVALIATAPLFSLYLPLFSIYGVRALGPALLVAAFLLPGSAGRRIAGGGTGLAVSFLLGIDQGLAAAAGVVAGAVLALALVPAHSRRAVILQALGVLGIGLPLFLLCVLAVATPSGFGPAMRYWFAEVPKDQFWFFGAPPFALVRWSQVFTMWRLWIQLGLSVAIVAICRREFLRRESAVDVHHLVATCFAVAYATFSYAAVLGMPDAKYLDAGFRMLLLFSFGLAWVVGRRKWARGFRLTRAWRGAVLAMGVVVLAALGLGVRRAVRGGSLSAQRLSPRSLAARARAPRLSEAFARDIDSSRAYLRTASVGLGHEPRVWPQFSGLLSYETGVLPPSFDYVVHAVGTASWARYLATFDRTRPDIVHLLRNGSLHGNPHWFLLEQWPFYERVLRGYQPAFLTPASVFWEPRASPLVSAPAFEVRAAAGARELTLPTDAADELRRRVPGAEVLYIVTSEHEVRNPWGRLPVVGQTPRFVIDVANSGMRQPLVSVRPSAPTMRFPVLVQPGLAPTLRYGSQSLLPGTRLLPRAVRVEPVALVGSDTLLFRN